MAIYTPRWISLTQALDLVRTTGMSEQECQSEICTAMSDRIFDVRVMTNSGETFEGATLTVPARLRPDDLDWKQSRPAFGWDLAPTYN